MMDFKVLKEPIELDTKCKCDKKIKLIGSSSSGYYTLCECNIVGYFNDKNGETLNYQRESNNDDENSFLTDTE